MSEPMAVYTAPMRVLNAGLLGRLERANGLIRRLRAMGVETVETDVFADPPVLDLGTVREVPGVIREVGCVVRQRLGSGQERVEVSVSGCRLRWQAPRAQ